MGSLKPLMEDKTDNRMTKEKGQNTSQKITNLTKQTP